MINCFVHETPLGWKDRKHKELTGYDRIGKTKKRKALHPDNAENAERDDCIDEQQQRQYPNKQKRQQKTQPTQQQEPTIAESPRAKTQPGRCRERRERPNRQHFDRDSRTPSQTDSRTAGQQDSSNRRMGGRYRKGSTMGDAESAEAAGYGDVGEVMEALCGEIEGRRKTD